MSAAIVFYDSSEDVAAIITQLESAALREAVSSVAMLTAKVPRSAIDLDLGDLDDVGLRFVGEGEIFRGYLRKAATSSPADLGEMVTLEVEGREVELRRLQMYQGAAVLDATPADALDYALGDSGWTGSLEGSGFPDPVSVPLDYMNRLEAVFELAKTLQGFVRFDRVNRVVTISNTPPSSGIVVADADIAGNSSAIGLLEAISEDSRDRSEVYNRVIPFAKIDSHDILGLEEATKSSPYTISSVVGGRPRIVVTALGSSSTDELNSGFQNRQGQRLDGDDGLVGRGVRRAAIGGHLTAGSSGNGNSLPGTHYYDGTRATFLTLISGVYTPVDTRQVRWHLFPYVPVGPYTVEWRYGSGNPADTVAFNISLENVDKSAGALRDVDESNGTSATPSATVDSEETDLVVSLLILAASRTPTPGAGQTLLTPDESRTTHISIKPGGASSTTMSYNLGTSTGYTHVVMSLKGAASFYLEDAASIAQYGLREYPLPLGTFKPLSNDLSGIADSMYDTAVDFLLDHKDERRSVRGDVAYLPGGALDWTVGSTMRLRTSQGESPIDADFVVPSRTQRFSSDGSRRWELEWATRNVFRASFTDILATVLQRLAAVQRAQV